MRLDGRRVRAIVRKELRDFRRNRNLIAGMAIVPLVFCVQPLVAVFTLDPAASTPLADEHVLLYMLGIPAVAGIETTTPKVAPLAPVARHGVGTSW